ncbi:MAG: transposase [Candidatus Sericytochromatia bacterium]
MSLYKNKYRIESIRLKNWDYSNNGFYFVTICTKNMVHFFGEIKNGEMILNNIGRIIYDEWYKSAEIRPNIILDEFIIMPNHIHGIIGIKNNIENENIETGFNGIGNENIETNFNGIGNENIEMNFNGIENINVETHCNASLRMTTEKTENDKNKKNNLSNIIRGFKSSTTKIIHIAGFNEFFWQPRFYEHIIKNKKSFQNIRKYIKNNPINWKNDTNNYGKLKNKM